MTEREQRVTPLELFFDLVFVYATTQVTTLMSQDLTWGGLGHGLLVFAALWWAWTGYAWLTNTLEPEEGMVRAGMFAGMGAMLVAATADTAIAIVLAFLAVILGTINVVGGFTVTDRMLEMFKGRGGDRR